MSPELNQAIELMKTGKTEHGARMLNAILKRPELSNTDRAIAYVWLAESQDDIYFKINCLNRAIDADPQNQTYQQRLNYLLAQQPQRPAYPTQRPVPPQGKPPTLPNQPASLPNPVLPDSQPINIISPDMSESQQMRALRDMPPHQDERHTTGQQFISDPTQRNQIMQQVNPPMRSGDTTQLPSVNMFDDRWATSTQPVVNQPNLTPRTPQSSAPHRLSQPPQVIGIRQGPNGNGSGVFVTMDGLIATTRYVIGGSEQVMVEIDTNYETVGRVVRTFPTLDLALIHVNVQLDRVWPPTQVPVMAENEAFVSIGYDGAVIRGNRRKSKTRLASHWIPTSIQLANLKDAGGHAIYDNNSYLLGILTHNASRETGYVYGLHISHIYNQVRQYLTERQQAGNAGYCTSCGNITRAEHYGGYYCETCGALLPKFNKMTRQHRSTPQLLQIYNENLSRACPRCNAKVGYYNAKCLRCSYDLEGKP